MSRTLDLIGLAQKGDKKARDTVVEENIALVWSVAKRFMGRGVEAEDLFQIGSIGLLKAVDKFDASFAVQFSTYAVPMIAGEMRRFLRDDGMLKVSRGLRERAYHAFCAREKLEKELGREPTLPEIAEQIEVPAEELVMALEASSDVESLQKVIYQGESGEVSLEDKLVAKGAEQEQLLNRIVLEQILGSLNGEERRLIYRRYVQEMTQAAIAREMGISQVQVSRMEKRILMRMREIGSGSPASQCKSSGKFHA